MIVRCICTCFYIGYLPASGTFASLCTTVIVFFFLQKYILYAILISSIVGTISTYLFTKKMPPGSDPRIIVVDELLGQLIALLYKDPSEYFYSFILFRMFDIIKPWPIYLVERIYLLKPSARFLTGLSIMLDDVVAGILTNITLDLWWYV